MTEIKHTPGPWVVAHKDMTGNVLVDAGPYYVCTCWHYHGSVVEKEMSANARLIAAAPELLDALYDVDATATDAYDPVMLAKVQAAIAKAEGRSRD